MGGERWDGKEEEGETKEESVGRWVVHIIVFSDGITDGSNPSVMPSVTAPRHCTSVGNSVAFLRFSGSVILDPILNEKHLKILDPIFIYFSLFISIFTGFVLKIPTILLC